MNISTRFNWRLGWVIVAVAIVVGSLFYSRYLSLKLDKIETQRVQTWVEAQKTIAGATADANLNLAIKISTENKDIPIIETSGDDSITGNYLNLDTALARTDPNYLRDQIADFKNLHPPIVLHLEPENTEVLKYYYGESLLQRELRYFPMIQLLIVALFITIIFAAQKSANKSTQNRLWVGMAKETAHQLGTPLTSLEGWVEILKQFELNEKDGQLVAGSQVEQYNNIIGEMSNDVGRLKLISDRFAKIGSHPKLEKADIVAQVEQMVSYIKRRAGGGVQFSIQAEHRPLFAQISPPLFDWVIENLLKNALDAMPGAGKVSIELRKSDQQLIIDIHDTGKGIPVSDQKKVFHPGYTTKKRGWGLGLALTKRIIQEYHHGNIHVKSSDSAKGTTFRITLNSVS